MNRALSYDDIVLVPRFSEIASRSDPDTSCVLGGIKLDVPIISANMDTVTGGAMATAMAHAGGVGAIHRFMSVDENVKEFHSAFPRVNCFVTVGVKDWKERGQALWDGGARHFIIDIAHGHSALMRDAIKGMRSMFGDEICIMAGNIATQEAVLDLARWGANIVKVGVGGGSICKTRVVTGHGMPMFTSVLECSIAADSCGVQIVADGGIRSSGDIVKAFVAGADAVMVGSLLAGTDETPGDIIVDPWDTSKRLKRFRGMASSEAQKDRHWGSNELAVAPEGVSTTVPCKSSVKNVLHELVMGLKSGMSYCNARTLDEIYTNARWREQTHSAYVEGTPHILDRK